MDKLNREIGGYLELETFHGPEYHSGALALNCARNCLVYLLEARGISRIWLPRFLCSSVAAAVRRFGASVLEYSTTRELLPDWETVDIFEGDYLYLVDYYGQLTDAQIDEARQHCAGRLIVDEVQAFFRRPVEGVDTLYCCRKFFGVPDGAYLYTGAKLSRALPQDSSAKRMAHVLGRLEDAASDHYAEYVTNDKAFADQPIMLMSPLTHNLLRGIDYDAAGKRRRNNFAQLEERLGPINRLKPRIPWGAYMYPLLIENGEAVRKQMQARKAYIPMLWPNAASLPGCDGELARNILPLPVDQRYGLDDMNYLSEMVYSLIS